MSKKPTNTSKKKTNNKQSDNSLTFSLAIQVSEKDRQESARREHEDNLRSYGLSSLVDNYGPSSIEESIKMQKSLNAEFSTPINPIEESKQSKFLEFDISGSVFNLLLLTTLFASWYEKSNPGETLIPTEVANALFSLSSIFLFVLFFLHMLGLMFFEQEPNEKAVITQRTVDPSKPVITPKRIKKDLHSTNILLFRSPMTYSIDEQLNFADKANEQVLANDVVIAAFDKEKTIDLTIANQKLKLLLSTLENSLLSNMK